MANKDVSESLTGINELLSNPDDLAATMKHEARTLPQEKVLSLLAGFIEAAQELPPMPTDPERIAEIRRRAQLYSDTVYRSCEEKSLSGEEALRRTAEVFDVTYRASGELRQIDETDSAWIWELSQQYRVYRDDPLEWGFDAQLCYRQYPNVPFTTHMALFLGLQQEMLLGAKERNELQ